MKTKVKLIIGDNDNTQVKANMNVVHNILNGGTGVKTVARVEAELAMAA